MNFRVPFHSDAIMSIMRCIVFLGLILDFQLKLASSLYQARVYVGFIKAKIEPDEAAFVKMTTTTRYQCAQLCYNYKLCKSLQFEIDNKLCRLNAMNSFELGFVTGVTHIVFADKGRISKSIAGICADHKCDIYSMCSDFHGKARCIQKFQKGKGCDFIMFTWPEDKHCMLPNPRTDLFTSTTKETSVPLGTVIDCTCNFPLQGIQKATCMPYDKWVVHLRSCYPDFCYKKFYMMKYMHVNLYTIFLKEENFHQQVQCIHHNSDWMKLQSRVRDENFVRSFNFIYDNLGFHPYWIGNTLLSKLTKEVELRVEFTVNNDSTLYFAEYGHFSINKSSYALSISNYLGGNCGDGLAQLNGVEFKVIDDERSGWWQKEDSVCTNLNADVGSEYLRWSTNCSSSDAVYWTNITSTRIMIKRAKKPWE